MARRKVYNEMPLARGFGKDNYFNRMTTCFLCRKSFESMDSPNIYIRRKTDPRSSPEILCQSCFEATDRTAIDITKAKPIVIVDDDDS